MIAQALGILGFILSIISFQQNTQKRIVLFQFLSNLSFCFHFYMIGAYTGSILNGIGIARSLVYYCKDKKWASSNWWIFVFSVVFVFTGVVTWEGPLSILPTAGMILTSISFGIKNPKIVRRVSFPSSPLWLTYNIIKGSYGGVLTECFVMVSILVAMYRFDRKNSVKE